MGLPPSEHDPGVGPRPGRPDPQPGALRRAGPSRSPSGSWSGSASSSPGSRGPGRAAAAARWWRGRSCSARLGAVVYLLVRYGRVTLPAVAADPEPEVMVELTRTRRGVARGGRCASRRRAGGRRACAAGTGRWSPTSSGAASSPTRPVAPPASTRATSRRRQPDAAPSFAAATELFEAAWYGGAVTGPAEAERFRELDARVLAVRA